MRSIIFYNPDGTIKCEMELTIENTRIAGGMLVRCTMKDSTEKVGYIETDDDNKHIILWTWKNVDEANDALFGYGNLKNGEECYKVEISQIEKLEAKLFSNPRWGCRITNKFE